MTLNLDKTRADPNVGFACTCEGCERRRRAAQREPRPGFTELPPGMAAEAAAMGLKRASDFDAAWRSGGGHGPLGKYAGLDRPRVDRAVVRTKLLFLLSEDQLDALLDLIHAERERRYAVSGKEADNG